MSVNNNVHIVTLLYIYIIETCLHASIHTFILVTIRPAHPRAQITDHDLFASIQLHFPCSMLINP